MEFEIFDTHAHLDGGDFAADRAQVIARARQAGVSRIITVGTDAASSAESIRIAGEFPDIFAVVGWHPNEAAAAPEDIATALRDMARHPKVVALGEMGLDYYRLPKPTAANAAELAQMKDKQARVFRQQLELAAELGLNCVVHLRGACYDDALTLLRPFAGQTRAVIHCFSEGPERLRQILDLGFIVSFTGILTYPNARLVRESLAAVPMDKFMLETDCPYLAPEPHRSKRCEPAYVVESARRAALVKACSLEELGAATRATAREFFGGRI